ncbi:MAG: hypothetical protein WCN95_01460, partial [bacterium]
VAIACALAAAVCHAKVFLRRTVPSGPGADSGLDTAAYATAMGVNGGKGQLQIFGFDGDFEEAVLSLRATLFAGSENHLKAGDGLAFGIIRSKTTIVRVLVTTVGEKCIVFKLEQSPAEFADSLRRASSSVVRGLPAYPGSVPVFSAGNDETESAIDVCRVNADPSTAWSFMDTSMRQAGWTTMAKPGQRPDQDGGGMGLYVRGREICCVLVRQRAEGADSLVGLLLHKRKNRNGENE